jgi:TatD DNase family protein
MGKNYIDIGINLTHKQFQNDIPQIIQNAIEAGVEQMVLTGTNVRNSEQAAQLAKKYPANLWATAGIHPHDAKHFDHGSIPALRRLLQDPQVVSVGECGLDFDRDFSPRPIQEACFEAQLQLAVEIQKPLFLHERAAFIRFNFVMEPLLSKLPQAVVHCFTGGLPEAKVYLDKGFFLGFTGAISDVRRFEQLREVIRYVPLDRMLIETDGPFMLPKNVPANQLTPHHERRNEPAFLPFVAETIAQFKAVPLEEIAQQTTQNAKRFFGI